jgi:uncharacterized membrane protein
MIELLWRQHTHWTMFLAGGVCFLTLYILNTKKLKLWMKCAAGAGVITAVEFLAGCLVNLTLGWGVWDYSRVPGNLLGQVCPLYSLLWAALCLPVTVLCDSLKARLRGQGIAMSI